MENGRKIKSSAVFVFRSFAPHTCFFLFFVKKVKKSAIFVKASGTTEFTYDLAGNLIEKLTANLAATKPIKYAYEYERLKSITYPENTASNVKYTYGKSTETDKNMIGRLMLLEDGSGAQEFKYGNMGELTELRRTLIIPDQAVATYVTKWIYDSWNRIQSMIYPDNETVNYTYDLGGQLTAVSGTTGYITAIAYDKFEQRNSITYGNGARTDYDYEPATRYLHNMKVNAAGKTIIDNTYGYDLAGNILNVNKCRAGCPQSRNGQKYRWKHESHLHV